MCFSDLAYTLVFTLALILFATFQLLLWSHLDAVDHTPRALRPVRAWLRASRTEPPLAADERAALPRTTMLAPLVEHSRAAAAPAATLLPPPPPPPVSPQPTISAALPPKASTPTEFSALTVGRWAPAAPSSVRWHYHLREDAGTRRGDAERTRADPPDATQYDWIPRGASASLPRFTAESFCAAARARGLRSLLMVGDSITFMQFQSLHALLGDGALKAWPHGRTKLVAYPQLDEEPDSGRWRGYVCGGTTLALAFVRNDCLCTGEDAANNPGGEYRTGWGTCNNAIADSCFSWIEYAAQYDLLLLNAGAHFHDRGQYERAMRRTVERLVKEELIGRVIFRTTPEGHPRCSDGTKPFVGDAAAGQAFVAQTRAAMDEGAYRRFGWTAFRGFNDYAAELFMARGARGVLDVVPMTALRPDGHRARKSDCLHYYLPGVPDWWNFLFFNLFVKTQ